MNSMLYIYTGLCPECSDKLNYHTKKREVKRSKKKTKRNKHSASTSSTTEESLPAEGGTSSTDQLETPAEDIAEPSQGNETAHRQLEQIFWQKSTNEEEKTREEEFDEYLADLLF